VVKAAVGFPKKTRRVEIMSHRFRRGSLARLGIYGAALLMMASPAKVLSQQQGPIPDAYQGVWNITMVSLSERPTRGTRNVLVRISEVDDGSDLEVALTNLRNEFVPVSDVTYDDAARVLSFRYGAFEYSLSFESNNELSGHVVSPAGDQPLSGARQAEGDLRFVGDREPPFLASRPGVIGHITEFAPPNDVTNPGEWVRSRISSPGDWALVIRQGVSIGFTNAAEFADTLAKNAGQRVDMTATWIGDKMEIVHIAPIETQ
jgi:hypothetical protein